VLLPCADVILWRETNSELSLSAAEYYFRNFPDFGMIVQSRRRKLATGRVRNTRIGHSINKICIARAAVMCGFHEK
jgi:hypothetical protein